jgi:hypothetical protein
VKNISVGAAADRVRESVPTAEVPELADQVALGGTVMFTKTVVPEEKDRFLVVVSPSFPDTSTVASAEGAPRGRWYTFGSHATTAESQKERNTLRKISVPV